MYVSLGIRTRASFGSEPMGEVVLKGVSLMHNLFFQDRKSRDTDHFDTPCPRFNNAPEPPTAPIVLRRSFPLLMH